MGDYKTVENFFKEFFRDADICVFSSHSHDNCINDIQEMIDILKGKYYNVEVVFFTNRLNESTEAISKLNWDSRNIIENPPTDKDIWDEQIKNGAQTFVDLIIRYAQLN